MTQTNDVNLYNLRIQLDSVTCKYYTVEISLIRPIVCLTIIP